MTAEVILTPTVPSPSAAVLARKRRREKMRGAPAATVVADTSPSSAKDLQTKGILPPKKRRVSVDSSDTSSTESSPILHTSDCSKKLKRGVKNTSGKKQMRYDPDVPMTKEEASAWRREARRVRNRESAAASRRKIRERIEVLEGEVEEWKSKYEAIMMKLEGTRTRSGETVKEGACVSPLHRPQESPVPVTSLSADTSIITGSSEGKSQQHLIETILRPAVKIAGAAAFPEPTPDNCFSQPMIDVMPNFVASSCVSDDSSKECLSTQDDELEDFVYDTFLTGIEPEFMTIPL